MRAVLFNDKNISFIEKPPPRVARGEVLIKPLMAGICTTDIELFKGYYGFSGVPGHEFVGTAERAPGNPELEGRRVVAEINIGCGECRWCRVGEKKHCDARRVIGIMNWDGAFSEYVKAPVDNIHVVDDAIGNDVAVFVEPLAAALQISQQLHVTGSQKVVVLGDGKLGILAALALRHLNPGLILVGKHAEKLRIAREQGVTTYRAESPDSLSRLRESSGPFDLAVEATGSAEGINHALGLIGKKGVIAAKTTSHNFSTIALAKIVVDEITVVGSRCGDFALALEFLKNRWLDVAPLIEAIYDFRQFPEAFDHAMRPGAGKILIRF